MIKYALKRRSTGMYVSTLPRLPDWAELSDEHLHATKYDVRRHVRQLREDKTNDKEIFDCVKVLVTYHAVLSEIT